MDVKKNNKILVEFAKSQDWQSIDYGKRNGKRFWIIEAYGNVIEKFNEWLQYSEYLKYVQEESGWNEVRYDDDSLWFDYLTDENWGYSDEYMKCHHCMNVININPSSGLPDNYLIYEGDLSCEECIRKDPEGYIESRFVNYDTGTDNLPADSIFSEKEWEDFGFVKVIDNLEVGMYGWYDDPKEFLNGLITLNQKANYICRIKSQNPFEVCYQIWKRKGR